MASGSGSEAVRVHLRRTGGLFAGARLEVDAGREDLGPAGVAALDRLLAGPHPFVPPATGGTADGYRYDLTVRRGEEEVVSLRVGELELPPELVPLVDALEQRARGERG
ncbi:protealysin inhibitor emfourin [Geodermatophilus sp. SYSU D01119]